MGRAAILAKRPASSSSRALKQLKSSAARQGRAGARPRRLLGPLALSRRSCLASAAGRRTRSELARSELATSCHLHKRRSSPTLGETSAAAAALGSPSCNLPPPGPRPPVRPRCSRPIWVPRRDAPCARALALRPLLLACAAELLVEIGKAEPRRYGCGVHAHAVQHAHELRQPRLCGRGLVA